MNMWKLPGLTAPLAVSVPLFFILFNNFDRGQLILFALLLLNLSVVLVPTRNRGAIRAFVANAKPAALCMVSLFGTLLAVEMLFPIGFPREYAEIQDLTKTSRDARSESAAKKISLFENQVRDAASFGAPATAWQFDAPKWHVPGAEFVYYGYEPNLRIRYVNRFRWNSQGYYDSEYPVPRAEGVRRIVVIGDSYVEAVQVPLARSFHKLLETSLNSVSQQSGATRFEVIALGNSGTGQVENHRILRTQAAAYSPDAVVMTLCSNDFCDDDPQLKKELVLAAGAVTPPIRRLAAHGYAALAFVVRRIDDLQRNRILVSPELLQWSASETPRVEKGWKRTLSNILASRDFCREHGILFLLVYLGSDLEVRYAMDPVGTVDRLKAMGGPHAAVRWDMSRSLNRVTQYCAEHAIPMVSLLEPLIAAQKETGHRVFGDHYTLFGHQVAAYVLNRALLSRLDPQAAENDRLKESVSPESWGSLFASEAIPIPAGITPVNLVPASGPAPQPK